MPDLTPLTIILYAYFFLVSAALVSMALTLQRMNKMKKEAMDKNAQSDNRITLLTNQLQLHQFRNGNGSLYEAICNTIDTPIFILSKTGSVQYLNTAAEKLTGVKASDVLTKNIQDIADITNDTLTSLENLLHQAKTDPIPLPKWTFIGSPGQPVTGMLIPFNDTSAGHILLYIHNAYDQYEKEKKLNELMALKNSMEIAESATTEIFNHLDIGILVLDSNGTIIHANPYAETFFRTTLNQLQNRPYKDVFILKNSKKEIDYTPLESPRESQRLEKLPHWTFLEEHQTEHAILGYITGISLTGTHDAHAFVFIDMTDQYHREEDEKAFFSGVAHDLRSPMTTIRGVLELLENPSPNMDESQKKDLMKGAKDSTIHLIDLVNDLLNVSRIEQNRLVIQKDIFDMTKTIRAVIENLKHDASIKHLTLTYQMDDPNIPKVIGDESKCVEILTNLLSNAIKYTHEGSVTVSTATESASVRTRITDTGAGIDPRQAPLLFTKFGQTGQSRSMATSKSTGLGLYISKRFAQLMNGSVGLEKSELGRGSTFFFSLPIAPRVDINHST